MVMDLLFQPSDQNVGAILDRLVETLERDYPNRIVAYYLRGSHADGSANDLSDVDFVVVVNDMNDTFAVSQSIGFASPIYSPPVRPSAHPVVQVRHGHESQC